MLTPTYMHRAGEIALRRLQPYLPGLRYLPLNREHAQLILDLLLPMSLATAGGSPEQALLARACFALRHAVFWLYFMDPVLPGEVLRWSATVGRLVRELDARYAAKNNEVGSAAWAALVAEIPELAHIPWGPEVIQGHKTLMKAHRKLHYRASHRTIALGHAVQHMLEIIAIMFSPIRARSNEVDVQAVQHHAAQVRSKVAEASNPLPPPERMAYPY